MGVPEKEERQKGAERIFEEIMGKNFHSLIKDMKLHTEEVQ